MPPQPTDLLRIPLDLASAEGSKLLQVGDLFFGEYQEVTQQNPRNVFVTEHTLIFVTKGAKVFHFPDRKLIVTAGHALFLQRGCYMLCASIEDNDAYESVSVFFNHGALHEFWNSLNRETKNSVYGKRDSNDINMVVLELTPALVNFKNTIVSCFSYEGKFLGKLMKVKLQELILLLLETSSAGQVISFFEELYAHSLPDPVYTVSQNLLKPLSIGDFAKLSNRSLSKFKRDFTKSSGQPPGRWISRKRLEYADMLIKTTDLTVGEICSAVD